MFVSALPDPTCNSEKSANGGNKQILYYYYYYYVKRSCVRFAQKYLSLNAVRFYQSLPLTMVIDHALS